MLSFARALGPPALGRCLTVKGARRARRPGNRCGYESVSAGTVSVSATDVVVAPAEREGADSWAVQTRGLTKRFGSQRRGQRCGSADSAGVRVRVSRSQRGGEDDADPGAARVDSRRRGDDVAAGLFGPKHRDRALARVGAIVDEPRFHGHLTGRQNLQVLAAAREPAARGRIEPSLDRVGMLHRADDRVSKYSMGMRQRLGVAACLIGDPQLLILDEPMNGLDPAGMHEMRDMIRSLVAEGRTVVLSSHLLDEVQRTCDAVAIVDRGNIIRQGPISEAARGHVGDPAGRLLRTRPGRERCSWQTNLAARGRRRGRRVGDHPACRHAPRRDRRGRPGAGRAADRRCIGCSRSRPRSSRGSCRSPAGWVIPQ